ncbi:TPA: hypothetical protein EYP26_04520 [Candidatus Bathyarchaeota archaeon]|nr:hypothetical protein [Candidatus Bathyarchaeota archaeon]
MSNKRSVEKPVKFPDKIEVVYDDERWKLLKKLRMEAIKVMRVLQASELNPMVHGSVARGDVDPHSDVDVVIPYIVPSHKVETALSLSGFIIFSRKITQATPSHAVKAHLYLDPYEKVSITFPLIPFKSLELEFYKFGGMMGLDGLISNKRVPGCTKRLTLVTPIPEGHMEFSILGRESEVSKILNVSIDAVNERIRVLTRRDKIGRTGVFLEKSLMDGESFEHTLKTLMDRHPAIRRLCASRLKR